MRIAFLTTEFVTEPYFAGGLAQYLGRIAPALAERGHEVEVFVTADEEGQTSYRGVLVHRVRPVNSLAKRTASRLHHIATGRRLTRLRQLFAFAKGLDQALRRRCAVAPFDIVQAASWMVTGLYAVRKPVAPVVIRLSSYGPLWDRAAETPPSWDYRIMWRLEHTTMHRATAVYAPSAYLAKHVSQVLDREISVVRPTFWQPDAMQYDPTVADQLQQWGPYLFYIGRLSQHKGIDLLREAVAPLLAAQPDLRLAAAGPAGGAEAERFLALAQAFPQQVKYLGVLRPKQLQPVVERARAVVLPSLLDNLPNACLEAMSCGQVVVGPDDVSFDELIEDGRSGILFEARNIPALTAAIMRAWHLSQREKNQYGRAARERIRQFNPECTLPELEQFFSEALELPTDHPKTQNLVQTTT